MRHIINRKAGHQHQSSIDYAAEVDVMVQKASRFSFCALDAPVGYLPSIIVFCDCLYLRNQFWEGGKCLGFWFIDTICLEH